MDPMRDVQDRLIMAVLPEIPFSGWSMNALRAAATALGLDASMAERAFPGGPVAAALHFADLADRRLAAEAADMDLSQMGMTARIKWLVRRRIDMWGEHKEAVRRAISLFSLPNHAGKASQASWRTADLIWHLAGDRAVDFSYYTKRFSLAARHFGKPCGQLGFSRSPRRRSGADSENAHPDPRARQDPDQAAGAIGHRRQTARQSPAIWRQGWSEGLIFFFLKRLRISQLISNASTISPSIACEACPI
jgi:rpsU-divergently transcribed protein